MLAGFEEAGGGGFALPSGEFVDLPVADRARRLLEIAGDVAVPDRVKNNSTVQLDTRVAGRLRLAPLARCFTETGIQLCGRGRRAHRDIAGRTASTVRTLTASAVTKTHATTAAIAYRMLAPSWLGHPASRAEATAVPTL